MQKNIFIDDHFEDFLRARGIDPTTVDLSKTKANWLKTPGLPKQVDPKNVVFVRVSNTSNGTQPTDRELKIAFMQQYGFTTEEINEILLIENPPVNTGELQVLCTAPDTINKADLIKAFRAARQIVTQNERGDRYVQVMYPEWVSEPIQNFINDYVREQQGIKSPNELDFEIIDNPRKCVIDSGTIAGDLMVAIATVMKDIPTTHKTTDFHMVVHGNINSTNIKQKTFDDDSFLRNVTIDGDFHASKHLKNFPYQVNGTFYCGDFKKGFITKDTVFPKTKTINCGYSISDFDVFMRPDEEDHPTKLVRTLPAEVKTLIVEPSLIRKENFENKKHFENIMNFKRVYGATITVQDPKGNTLETNLNESIFGTEKPKREPKKPQQTAQQKSVVLPLKRKGVDLSVIDLIKMCRYQDSCSKEAPKYKDFEDNDLRNLIKDALKYKNLTKKTVQDENGNPVECIEFTRTNLELFFKNLDEVIAEYKQKHETTSLQQTKTTTADNPTKEKPKVTYEKKDIKKYMTKRQFNEIAKSIKKDVALKLVNAVNQINLDPLDVRSGKTIPMVNEKNEITATPTIEKLGGCCLRQKYKSKSIIWQMATDQETGHTILVCVGFSTTSTEMQNLTDQAWKPKTYTDKELKQNGYVEVCTILEEQKTSDLYDNLSQHNPTGNMQTTTPVR